MFSHIFVGADDIAVSKKFYDAVLGAIGVPEGKIDSITPRAGYVEVVMSLPVSVKLPSNVVAYLMAPNPVSDRFVQLEPPYTGGPNSVNTWDDTAGNLGGGSMGGGGLTAYAQGLSSGWAIA